MKGKVGSACMVLGVVLILLSLSLFLWNQKESQVAAENSAKIVSSLAGEIGANAASYPDPYDPAMAEKQVGSYSYIGYLSFPSLGLELPVMSDWSYPRLRIAPCRYAGSAKTDDLVIAAHNYASHFGRLRSLSVGSEIYFTDMEGVVYSYEVADIEILPPSAVAEMTSGDNALTLFTCTYGGQNRVTVRCSRVNGEK